MPRVIFIHPDGARETHELKAGDSVMDAALDNAVKGILAQCGGGCTCSTCHCYVEPPWGARVEPPVAEELELLEYVYDREPTSRLACQVFVSDDLDGIVVRIPIRQT